jgi:hypothetical protein
VATTHDKGEVDWRRLASDRNISHDVARGLWAQAQAAAPQDTKQAERVFLRSLEHATAANATHEPGKETLVDAKGVKDPASLGPGKWTRVLLENNDRGPAGTAAKRKAPGQPDNRPVTVEKLHKDLAAVAASSKHVIELLKNSDEATIVEALRELKEIEGPEFLKKLLTFAGGEIEKILEKYSPEQHAQATAAAPAPEATDATRPAAAHDATAPHDPHKFNAAQPAGVESAVAPKDGAKSAAPSQAANKNS